MVLLVFVVLMFMMALQFFLFHGDSGVFGVEDGSAVLLFDGVSGGVCGVYLLMVLVLLVMVLPFYPKKKHESKLSAAQSVKIKSISKNSTSEHLLKTPQQVPNKHLYKPNNSRKTTINSPNEVSPPTSADGSLLKRGFGPKKASGGRDLQMYRKHGKSTGHLWKSLPLTQVDKFPMPATSCAYRAAIENPPNHRNS